LNFIQVDTKIYTGWYRSLCRLMLKFIWFDAKVHSLIYFLRFALKFMQRYTGICRGWYGKWRRDKLKLTHGETEVFTDRSWSLCRLIGKFIQKFYATWGGTQSYSENILKFMRCDTKVHTDIVKFIQGILGFIRLIPIIVLSLYRVIQKYIDTGVYIGWYWICTWFGLIPNNIGLILKVIQVDTIYTGWIEFYSYTQWFVSVRHLALFFSHCI